MKILLDTCISSFAKGDLQAAGHDVLWMGDRATDPGDEAILALAHGDRRILFTLDKDFGELAILRGLPHSGIVRLANARARQQGQIAAQILESHGAELLAGAIITAAAGRLRIRQAQPPNDVE
jgi:predicted nuclease of predicted toxin-antitoxin system